MSDPIRDAMARRETTVYELPEAYRTSPPATPANVYSLTPGAGSSSDTTADAAFAEMLQDVRDGVHGGGFLHHVI